MSLKSLDGNGKLRTRHPLESNVKIIPSGMLKIVRTFKIRELEGVCLSPHQSCYSCWQESNCATEAWGKLFFDIYDNPDKYWVTNDES